MLKIIVPVKDRFRHLNMSLPVNYDLLKNYFGEETFEVTVIQQSNNKPWNIGKVVNTGFDIIDCDDKDDFMWFPADYICNPEMMHGVINGCCFLYAFDQIPRNGFDEMVWKDMCVHLALYKYTGGYSHISITSSVFRKINGMIHNLEGWGYDDWVLTNRLVNYLDWDKIVFAGFCGHHLGNTRQESDSYKELNKTSKNRVIADRLMKNHRSQFYFCQYHQRWEKLVANSQEDQCQHLPDEINDLFYDDITAKDLSNDNNYKIKSKSTYKDFDKIKWYEVDW